MCEGAKILWREMPPHWKRLGKAVAGNFGDITHAYVNIFTESYRAAPYFMAHISSVFYPVAVLMTGAAIWLW